MFRIKLALAVLCVLFTLAIPAAATTPIDQAGWAERKQFVRLPNGLRLVYVEADKPNGPPLLLLHGFTDSSRIWTALLPYLADQYVLVLDQRGHGASDAPACCYSPTILAEDARLFLDALGIERASVVGHSLGSMVGQVLAAEHPQRVDKLVLAASTALAPIRRGDWLWQRTVAAPGLPSQDAAFMAEWTIGASPTPVDPLLVRYWDEDAKRIPDHVWRAIPRELLDVPVGRYAADVRAPVLILSASADPLFSDEHHQSLLRAYPNAKAKLLPGLGHNFIVERLDQVGPMLAAFLAFGNQ
jgi:pimeloyl-ACP methyl ester carboxylesterase